MSMLYQNTFPNNIVNIKDESAGTRVDTIEFPLHRPLIFIRAAQGDDKCEWINGTQAYAKYGEQTFDKYEPYWRGEQCLLTDFILSNQGAYIKRIIPSDAKVATLVIEAYAYQNVDIVQYRRDDEGRFVYDFETGEPLMELDTAGNPVTMKGTRVKYLKRPMTDLEMMVGYNNIPVKTVMLDNKETKIYPMVAVQYKSACAMGNKAAFKMYIDIYKQTQDLVEATNSLLWTFAPSKQPYNSNIAYPIRDKFESVSSQMTLRPNQIDPYTVRRISAKDTIDRLFYNESTKINLLPYDIHFYSDNFEIIGDMVRETEIMNTTLTSGYMVNISTMTDADGNPYFTAEIDTSDINSVKLGSLSDHYLEGGSDGDLSDETFELGVQQALQLYTDPELGDRFHYMITHLYDVGYTLQTKFAMTDFMSMQGFCKVIMAAQDANRHLYDMDEAVSVAAAIRARCAITPESELYGTQAMRATIYSQSGYLNDTSVPNIVPMTFWAAGKRATFHNSTRIKGSWAAAPDNVISIYRETNFTPYSDSQKQLLWDGAANYFQWKNGTDKFMPSCRSIYKDTTSLLSDDEFTDACIYLKYITDKAWTEHVSRKLPFGTLANLITEEINSLSFAAFGTLYDVSANVYLSEEDLSNHDTLTIEVILQGDYPKRIWKTTVIARGRSETTTGG